MLIKQQLPRGLVILASAACALAMAACGSSGSTSNTASLSGSNSTARALLPESIRQSGKIVDGSEIDYAPYIFYNKSEQPVGLEVDMLTAIGKVLGVGVEIQNIQLPSVIPALQTGRIDVGANGYFITAQRRQQVSFVYTQNSTNSLLIRKGNPSGITPSTMCGKTIGVEASTNEIAEVDLAAKQCTSTGKPAPVVSNFPTLTAQTLAIQSGRIDGGPMGTAGATYIAQTQSGTFALAPGLISGGVSPIGIMMKKGNTQLGKAIVAAIKLLIQDGKYQSILKKWGVAQAAVTPKFEP